MGLQRHAVVIALNAQHGRIQAFVGQACQDFFHIVTRTALHRVPLRAMVDLNQAMVVTKPHHRGHREQQHLIGRTTPDASENGQEIPVPEGLSKMVAIQKLFQPVRWEISLKEFIALVILMVC